MLRDAHFRLEYSASEIWRLSDVAAQQFSYNIPSMSSSSLPLMTPMKIGGEACDLQSAESPCIAVVSAPARTNNLRYRTPALEKGLDILELLAGSPDGLPASEIARRLDRTLSEIFRMILCLEHRGYLAHSLERDRYQLTTQLFRLAQQHLPTRRLLLHALPAMNLLAATLRQSCHLSVLDREHAVVLAHTDSPEPTDFVVKPGARMELLKTATGHVLLANQDERTCERVLTQLCVGKNVTSDLLTRFHRVRQRGFEKLPNRDIAGILNISTPLLDQNGSLLACVTVPLVKRLGCTTEIDDVVYHLRETCQTISDALGAPYVPLQQYVVDKP